MFGKNLGDNAVMKPLIYEPEKNLQLQLCNFLNEKVFVEDEDGELFFMWVNLLHIENNCWLNLFCIQGSCTELLKSLNLTSFLKSHEPQFLPGEVL